MQLDRTACCGLRGLHGIQDYDSPTPKSIVLYVKRRMREGLDAAFITFASAVGGGAGGSNYAADELAEYITENKLGDLSDLKPAFNPNSEHKLTVYLWRVNRTAIFKFTGVKKPKAPAKAKQARKK